MYLGVSITNLDGWGRLWINGGVAVTNWDWAVQRRFQVLGLGCSKTCFQVLCRCAEDVLKMC